MDRESDKFRGIVASLKKDGDDAIMESIQELSRLAETADIQVVSFVTQSKPAPDPWSYFGAGKVEELRNLCETLNVQVLLVNDDLSPGQEQALNDLLGIEILDRTALILRIFASHARTREAKLQVELASLRHQLTRLRGKGESMSRTGGGIGTRGPGEQELEVKRRLIRDRIRHISREIEAVSRRRALYRERRKKAGIPVVALAGYTNAGKSTLFKKLTGRDVLVEDKLFSTLDPRAALWALAPGLKVLLVDTVGFLRDLPHHLVAAFRSTLDESLDADLILHVVDVSSSSWESQAQTVVEVLKGLGKGDTPTITCFNKIDKGPEIDFAAIEKRYEPAQAISALTGEGLDRLGKLAASMIGEGREEVSFEIPYSRAELLSEIHRRGRVLGEEYNSGGIKVNCLLLPADARSILKRLYEGKPTDGRLQEAQSPPDADALKATR